MSLLWADVQTTEADFPILTELGGPPGRTEASNIHVVRMGPGYRPERPKYRPLRGRPSCRSEDSVIQVKSTVHVWSLAFLFHKFNPVHVNQIHSRPRLKNKTHLFISYEKVSPPYAEIFSGDSHSFLVSKLDDKVADSHGTRVRRGLQMTVAGVASPL